MGLHLIILIYAAMAVTELALFRLREGTDVGSKTILNNLLIAKRELEKGSGFEFSLWHCIEEPSLIYLIGAWSSVQYHMEKFLPSSENQELLSLFKDLIDVDWMFHIAIDQTKSSIPLDAKILAVGRHFVKDEERLGFQEAFDANKFELESYIGGTEKIVGGWRIDRGVDTTSKHSDQEFVSFTGWESVDQHVGFANTEGFKKYSMIKDHLESAEIRHCKQLKIE